MGTEQGAWVLAKSRKVAGGDTLFNTLGNAPCVRALVAKIRQAWHCETAPTGTLRMHRGYTLDAFAAVGSVDPGLAEWISGGWQRTALFIHGPRGFGKTEFACAVMHCVAPAKRCHFLNKIDRLRDVSVSPGEGLVVDEACFANREVDDVKGVIDLKKGRDVTCRNRDGHIPKGTPRIFTTNWAWEQFWPQDAFLPKHLVPIERRILWVTIKEDLRKGVNGPSGSGSPALVAPAALPVAEEEERNPFNHSCSLDESEGSVRCGYGRRRLG